MMVLVWTGVVVEKARAARQPGDVDILVAIGVFFVRVLELARKGNDEGAAEVEATWEGMRCVTRRSEDQAGRAPIAPSNVSNAARKVAGKTWQVSGPVIKRT